MAALSIEDIVSAAQNFASTQAAGAAEKKIALREAQTALGEQKKILDVVAQDMATVKAVEQAATLKTQSQVAGQAAAVGISGEDPANYLIQLATRQKGQNEALAGQLGKITEKTSVNFLDSPLQWVGAQIALPKEEEIARAQLAQVQQTHSTIQQTAQTFSLAAQTYKLQEQNVTAASATAATRIAASSALISAQQTEIEAAKYNVEAVNSTLAASNAELQASSTIYQAQSSQEGQKMQQLAFNQQAQQIAFQREMAMEDRLVRAENRDARLAAKSLDESSMNYMNLSLAQAGMPPVTAEDAPIFLAKFKSGDPELMNHWRNGRVISTQPVSKTRMGGTVAESAEFLSRFPTNLEGLRKDTAALIMSATEKIPLTAVTPKAKADWLNKNVQDTVNLEYSNIIKGSIFDAGDVSQYFGIQSIAQLPLVSKVLGPLGTSGIKLDEPALVLKAGIVAMKAGTITSTELSSGVEQLYRKASMTNIAYRDLQGFGIKIPEGGNTYNVKLDRWGKPVNLLKSEQLNRWIIEQSMRTGANDIASGRAANPFPMN